MKPVFLVLALLAGCTVGPDYKGPPDTVSASRFVRAAQVQTNAAPPPALWWTAFGDPVLNWLEEAALAANPDLQAATARLRQSRGRLREQEANLRPTTGSTAAYLHSHGGSQLLTGAVTGGGSSSESIPVSSDVDLYDVGFDASWEIDLFGGKRRAAEGAAADLGAAQANLADTQVSLAAEVAQAYVSLRDLQHRTALARASAELQGRMLDLTRTRLAGGTASVLDVARLNTQVEQTRADLVPLQAQIAEQLDRLATLTGQVPGTLDPVLTPPKPLPLPPTAVAIGDPAALLRRRPDIRAAERQIASQNAAIGQHIADYFPKLQLLGSLGFTSTDISQLFSGGALTALVAPVLQWKPLDFGRTAAQVEQARAGTEEAIAKYRSTVLNALQETETGLARYASQRDDVRALARVKASADQAASLTRQRLQGGTATLIDTLDTERQRLQAEQALAQAEGSLTQDFVSLQKSLGLGWQDPIRAATPGTPGP